MLTIDQLIQKWQGKTYAEDPKLGKQCVAWAKLAARELYGIQLGSFSGSANNGFVTGSPFNSDWQKVYNTPANCPSPGDIIFWGKSSKLPYGHVAIVVKADTTNITVLEQNAVTGNGKGLGGDAISYRTHSYNGVSGWYTYKKKITLGTAPTTGTSIIGVSEWQPLIDDKLFSGDMNNLTNERLLVIMSRIYKKLKK